MTNIKPPGRYLSIKKDGGAKSTKGHGKSIKKMGAAELAAPIFLIRLFPVTIFSG
jgi:hypothetical protein